MQHDVTATGERCVNSELVRVKTYAAVRISAAQKLGREYFVEVLSAWQKEVVGLYKKLQSPEYRLGHFLLKPYRFIKRVIK